jgi:hypothetical protein
VCIDVLYGDVLYGDVLKRRRFVEETLCRGEVLYVRRRRDIKLIFESVFRGKKRLLFS